MFYLQALAWDKKVILCSYKEMPVLWHVHIMVTYLLVLTAEGSKLIL